MAILYDKDGNEVEALTAEEQEQLKSSVIEEFKKSNPDIVNVDSIKEKLSLAEKELRDLKTGNEDKSRNIDGQKKTIEQKEREIEELKTQMATSMKEVKDYVVGKTVGELIKKVSGGDVELGKKIKHHFDSTLSAMKAETDEELAEKITAALKLSSDKVVDTSNFSSIASSSDVSGGKSDTTKPSQGLIEIGKKFGINEEDWKKFGGKQ